MPEWKAVPDNRVRREHLEDPDAEQTRAVAAAVVRAAREADGECVAVTVALSAVASPDPTQPKPPRSRPHPEDERAMRDFKLVRRFLRAVR